jgi:hypothetical protein
LDYLTGIEISLKFIDVVLDIFGFVRDGEIEGAIAEAEAKRDQSVVYTCFCD